jgi:multidrug resistance protein
MAALHDKGNLESGKDDSQTPQSLAESVGEKSVEATEEHPSSVKDIEQTVSLNGQQLTTDAAEIKPNDIPWPVNPANPQNWSWTKRCWHIFNTSLLALLVTFASSSYTPSIPEVMHRFNVSQTAAILGLSLYVLGLGFGPILAAPMSETFGRNIVYKITTIVFMLFILGSGLAQNFGTLLVCRFLAGMIGGPCLAVGAGTIADLLPLHIRGTGSSFFIVGPFLGPSLGPFIGGFVAQYKDWRWTQWVILFAGLPIFLVGFTTQETYQKVIIKREAKKQGKPIPIQGPTGAAAIKFLLTVTLFRPVHMLLTEPIVTFLSMYTAFTFAVLFGFFDAFPIVFEGVYHFSISETGLAFLAIGLGCSLGLISLILFDRKVYLKMHNRLVAQGGTMVAPEHRLYAAMLGSFLIPIGLFWFAWTARASVHWIVPIIGAIPFAWGNLAIFVSTIDNNHKRVRVTD